MTERRPQPIRARMTHPLQQFVVGRIRNLHRRNITSRGRFGSAFSCFSPRQSAHALPTNDDDGGGGAVVPLRGERGGRTVLDSFIGPLVHCPAWDGRGLWPASPSRPIRGGVVVRTSFERASFLLLLLRRRKGADVGRGTVETAWSVRIRVKSPTPPKLSRYPK